MAKQIVFISCFILSVLVTGCNKRTEQKDNNVKVILTLKNIEEILPWYSEINPKCTVEIVNYMKNEVQNGNQIFYDIYTDQEKKEDPDKRNTGLFFFKGKAGEKTAITNAGGGFMYVAEIQIFDGLTHGFGLGEGTVAEGWINEAVRFWERQVK